MPPSIGADWETVGLVAEADHALGRLEGTARELRTPYLLIGPLQRREAIVSSRIEGTFTTAEKLVLFEAVERLTDPDSQQAADTREVHNYVRALQHGLSQLPTMPVCLRLIREMHGILLAEVRGSDRRPGEFRTQQNAIGKEGDRPSDARFVPPPPGPELEAALDALEKVSPCR
ncbi:MAG: hypothetical protein KF894_29510 [Labilithrix sp.]|nr:hypothetical protein [Labilithrix sp.]